MVAAQQEIKVCDAAPGSRDRCWGEVMAVDLTQAGRETKLSPSSLKLCQHHYHFELMEWGAKVFLKKYPFIGKKSIKPPLHLSGSETFPPVDEQALEEFDSHFRFRPPEVLETMIHASQQSGALGGYHPRIGFEHLKEVDIDLNRAGLTHKQLIAVSLVFYGGVKKKHAADAMGISSQALSDHIKAALKKIEKVIR